ncbi:hypothetical protein B0A55_02277 [Friedmanniomyces simplex]|uniref:Uncharacterized protein n=1 Tax=Friedmanniomyces simplex TaxID=329884 RepID=A0A4V5NID0_9PEZI|nr:hypothetical protein B0A55_02277 [Friedmanniomyces simplex]
MLAARVDHAKLAFFSDLAVAQLGHGTPEDSRQPKKSVTLAQGIADGKAVARIGTWIEMNDLNTPTQLTLAALNLEFFTDIVLTYATSHALRLKRQLRGDDIRTSLYDYIHQGNFTCDEFAMIVEFLALDGGLVKTAVHETMFRACKGGVFVPKEMGRIEEYAKQVGMWEEMASVGVEIRAKMEERNRQDAEMAKWAGVRRR